MVWRCNLRYVYEARINICLWEFYWNFFQTQVWSLHVTLYPSISGFRHPDLMRTEQCLQSVYMHCRVLNTADFALQTSRRCFRLFYREDFWDTMRANKQLQLIPQLVWALKSRARKLIQGIQASLCERREKLIGWPQRPQGNRLRVGLSLRY
jgi:hypothetical protein